jgi:serine/threonine protein kinase
VLKVGDWGFGAHLNGLKNNTILGTEGYMAPEIHLKLNYKSEEVDLFACAIILFIMVSGNPPFSRAHKNDLYYSLIMNKNSADKFW